MSFHLLLPGITSFLPLWETLTITSEPLAHGNNSICVRRVIFPSSLSTPLLPGAAFSDPRHSPSSSGFHFWDAKELSKDIKIICFLFSGKGDPPFPSFSEAQESWQTGQIAFWLALTLKTSERMQGSRISLFLKKNYHCICIICVFVHVYVYEQKCACTCGSQRTTSHVSSLWPPGQCHPQYGKKSKLKWNPRTNRDASQSPFSPPLQSSPGGALQSPHWECVITEAPGLHCEHSLSLPFALLILQPGMPTLLCGDAFPVVCHISIKGHPHGPPSPLWN